VQVLPAEGGQQPQATQAPAERQVSEADKKLAADWLTRIEAALTRVKDKFDTFEANRQLLAGKVSKGSKETVRANLHYANMASMLPQVYAKDPEFAAQPTPAVPPEQMEAVKRFAETAEIVLEKLVVKDARLKKQAKKQLRSVYATSVGWLKASWQEKKEKDPLIANQLKDTQDNIARVELLLKQANDPTAKADEETRMAKLRQALEGLEAKAEVTVARGIALDFVMSEDIVVVDPSIRSIDDYTRAEAIAHRVWMTCDKYEQTFGYKPTKAKNYTEQGGSMTQAQGTNQTAALVCVWEIWSQADNRVFYVCSGEEGFCKPPSSPEWTGKRWYPFFLLAVNEIDGSFYPLSDIELTDKLVKEYNTSREDFVRDRKTCLPIRVIRKGGSLTPDDVKNVTNAEGGDTVVVDGVGNNPITNDIWSGQLGSLDPKNYDTAGARHDIERILGGSDATTGSITKAKTATEAEILSQGLRSRSGERQDILEDMFNELGPYCVEICLRKLSPEEVRRIAGPQASWPQMGIEDIFNLVSIEVRGGSTGKPDRLQEQDRWTKLLPIVNEAVGKVAELRSTGQEPLAQAVIEITRETLRRFDERLDIEQFLPAKPEGEDDPAMLKQQTVTLQQQVQELMGRLKEASAQVEKSLVSAHASISTSQRPALAAQVFTSLQNGEVPPLSSAGDAPAEELGPVADSISQPQGLEPAQDEIPPQLPEPPLPQP
jgi:hypothetical protein